MAVYDLEEQEQLDEFKAWWGQYRKLVLLVVIAAAVTVSAIQGWRYYQNKQAFEAGELYSQLQGALGSGDQKKVQDIAAVLVEKYPRTGYALFGALAGAKAAFDSGDAAGAKTRLQWVAANGKEDEMRDIARLRLAAVLLDEKVYDEALKLLEAQHAESLSALYADLKGDVLVAQGKSNEARGAYQLALDKSGAKSAYRALIQVKLDALGEAK
jgi:predicted negative regulator of RcsB-dependent stress response